MENAISAHSLHYQISAIRIRPVCHAALNCPIKCTQIRASSSGKSVVKRFLTFSNRAFTRLAAYVHMLPWQMNISLIINTRSFISLFDCSYYNTVRGLFQHPAQILGLFGHQKSPERCLILCSTLNFIDLFYFSDVRYIAIFQSI